MIMKFSYLNKRYTLFLHTITLNRQSTTFKIKEIPLREFSVTTISSSFVSYSSWHAGNCCLLTSSLLVVNHSHWRVVLKVMISFVANLLLLSGPAWSGTLYHWRKLSEVSQCYICMKYWWKMLRWSHFRIAARLCFLFSWCLKDNMTHRTAVAHICWNASSLKASAGFDDCMCTNTKVLGSLFISQSFVFLAHLWRGASRISAMTAGYEMQTERTCSTSTRVDSSSYPL